MLPKICSIPECINLVGPKGARGFCTKHYQMWLKVGDPEGTTAPTVHERFFAFVRKGPECWEWGGGKDQSGYGLISVAGKTQRAHRWSYEQHVEQIPEGLQIDHLCRNRGCVNPSHLEPVTRDENLERGWGRRIKTGWINECIHGHEFTLENTYINKKGRKICRICRAESQAKYAKRKAASNG